MTGLDLHARVALITGAGSGIGQAIATRFAAEGSMVVGVDRDADGLAATVDAINETGGRAIGHMADVTDPGGAPAAVAAALEAFGRLDVLVTAAGRSVGKDVARTTLDEWNEIFAVNVTGTFLFCQAALEPMLAARSGSIITVASQLAFAGGRSNAAYVASKGAIVSLTRTMAFDYAKKGVRVNALVPGAIQTPLLERSFARLPDPDSAREGSLARHPMGRFGRPQEVAAAALFLASDESSFVTGSELTVDGGWLAG